MTEFERRTEILDIPLPFNVPLAAKYKRSFAFYTVYKRLPIILTKIVDSLIKDKDELAAEYSGDITREDVKECVAQISQLKYELQTDKEFTLLSGKEVDKDTWNEFLLALGPDQTFFSATWLYAETYMYRRLKSIFESTNTLQDYDYFKKQKDNGLIVSVDALVLVAKHLQDFYDSLQNKTEVDIKQFFFKVLRINLWGNRCDLSITNGREVKQAGNPFFAVDTYEESILVDRTTDVWNCVKAGGPNCVVDFVLDNAGYELFTDFAFADFLIQTNLVGKIRFHVKAIPWFISDATQADFHWTIKTLADHSSPFLKDFGKRLEDYVKDDKLELVKTNWFWTSPYEFQAMKRIAPKLYEDLSTVQLVIFKGDLNYRKLLADFNWPHDSKFTDVLREFRPNNICSLRTVKADLICEIKNGVSEELAKLDPLWMETGQYGLIHFAPRLPNQ